METAPLRIRKRFGRPFVEIVRDLAKKECLTKAAAARRLGMSWANFHGYCTRFDLHKYFADPPRVRALEVEYGESFCDIVRGFASMGYSKDATGRNLELERSYYRSLLTRYGLHEVFTKNRMELRPECRGVGHPSRTSRNCKQISALCRKMQANDKA